MMIKLFAAIFFSFFTILLCAQTSEYEQLKFEYERFRKEQKLDSVKLVAKEMNRWALIHEGDTSLRYAVSFRYIGNGFQNVDSALFYYNKSKFFLEHLHLINSIDYLAILGNIGYNLMLKSDLNSALEILELGLRINRKNHYEETAIGQIAINNLALVNLKIGKINESIKYYDEYLEIRRKASSHDVRAYYSAIDNVARIFLTTKPSYIDFAIVDLLFKSALYYYQKALSETKNLDFPYYGYFLNEVGFAYYKNGDFKNAIINLKEALEIKRQAYVEAPADFANTAQLLANAMHKVGEFDYAKALYLEALHIYSVDRQNQEMIASIYARLADLSVESGSLEDAITFYAKADTVFSKLPLSTSYGVFCLNYGIFLGQRNNDQLSLEFHKEAVTVLKNVKYLDIVNLNKAIRGLSNQYEKIGDFKNTESVKRNAYTFCLENFGAFSREAVDANLDLANFYYRRKQYTSADSLFGEACNQAIKFIEVDQKYAVNYLYCMAINILALDSLYEAESYLVTIIDIYNEYNLPADLTFLRVYTRLIDVSLKLNDNRVADLIDYVEELPIDSLIDFSEDIGVELALISTDLELYGFTDRASSMFRICKEFHERNHFINENYFYIINEFIFRDKQDLDSKELANLISSIDNILSNYELNFSTEFVDLYRNLANYYWYMGDEYNSRRYIGKLQFYLRDNYDVSADNTVYLLNALASFYLDHGDLEGASNYYEPLIDLTKDRDNYEIYGFSLHAWSLAMVAYNLISYVDSYDEAMSYFSKALFALSDTLQGDAMLRGLIYKCRADIKESERLYGNAASDYLLVIKAGEVAHDTSVIVSGYLGFTYCNQMCKSVSAEYAHLHEFYSKILDSLYISKRLSESDCVLLARSHFASNNCRMADSILKALISDSPAHQFHYLDYINYYGMMLEDDCLDRDSDYKKGLIKGVNYEINNFFEKAELYTSDNRDKSKACLNNAIHLANNYILNNNIAEYDLMVMNFNSWFNLNGWSAFSHRKLIDFASESSDREIQSLIYSMRRIDSDLVKSQVENANGIHIYSSDWDSEDNRLMKMEYKANIEAKMLEKMSSNLKEHNSTGYDQIVAVLDSFEVYVDIAEVPYYDYKTSRFTDSSFYICYVITGKGDTPLTVAYLGNGKQINEVVFPYLNGQVTDSTAAKMDGQVYDLLWKPLEEHLAGKTKIYIYPGGIYHSINLETIYHAETEKYLFEEREINLLSSGRSFVDERIYGNRIFFDKSALIMGAPNFDFNSDLDLNWWIDTVNFEYRNMRELSFDHINRAIPLPASRLEVEAINKRLQSNSWNTLLVMGDEMMESRLKRMESPRILHIATHGFFLEDISLDKLSGTSLLGMDAKRLAVNPMLRSGLLMTGCNKTLSNNSTFAASHDDGIFTALEASLLDLSKTELVVLSACETGRGEIKNGEGVQGLRKAMTDAGAEHILMSLWKVDDKVTSEYMQTFYGHYAQGKSIRESYNLTRNEIKQKYPQPYYWGAFVLVGN